ncbi:hypothetical protein EJB05_01260, partial [Eragrostis curvula]
MSAFAWACISEGLNPEPHAFYRVYQARHTPTYDHEQHLSPCFGVVGFEAREGFLTPLGSFDPPPFDEWVKDWFYYKYLAIDFYTGKAAGIWITNDLEPSHNGLISQCVDAFRRVSQRMTLRDILEECFAAGVFPLARRSWRPSSFGRNKFGLRMPVFPSISGPCMILPCVSLPLIASSCFLPFFYSFSLHFVAFAGFNLWSPQDRVTSFLGKFSRKEWVESTRRGISVRINRFYLSFDLCLHNRPFPGDNSCERDIFPYFSISGSSTVEMDPSLAVVTPDVESIPRNTEIPSSPGSLLVPTYSFIFEEPSPDAPSNSAIPPAVLDIACESSSMIPSEGLQGSLAAASNVVCTDVIEKRSELVNSCPLVPECSKGTFGLPKKSSFFGLLGKRKLSEVSGPSQDITSTSGTALPSISVAVPPSQSSNPDASSLGSLELDVETMLSSINDDIQASGALESAARKVRFPKVELGLSNLSGDVLFRSLVAHQIKSIILTRACPREFQDSSGDLQLASSLQASLSAKDDSLKASSAATSDLLAEVEVLRSHKSKVISDLSVLEEKIHERKASLEKEKLFNEHLLSRLSKASQLKISSVDNSFAKSLVLCDLVKELVQALGAKYDEVPADASLEVLGEWLRLNLAGLVDICRSFSYDAVVLMIRDLLHSFSCEGSDAINLVSCSDFSMKPSDPSHDFGAVEGKCMCLINDFWWNRVKCLVPDFPEGSS